MRQFNVVFVGSLDALLPYGYVQGARPNGLANLIDRCPFIPQYRCKFLVHLLIFTIDVLELLVVDSLLDSVDIISEFVIVEVTSRIHIGTDLTHVTLMAFLGLMAHEFNTVGTLVGTRVLSKQDGACHSFSINYRIEITGFRS